MPLSLVNCVYVLCAMVGCYGRSGPFHFAVFWLLTRSVRVSTEHGNNRVPVHALWVGHKQLNIWLLMAKAIGAIVHSIASNTLDGFLEVVKFLRMTRRPWRRTFKQKINLVVFFGRMIDIHRIQCRTSNALHPKSLTRKLYAIRIERSILCFFLFPSDKWYIRFDNVRHRSDGQTICGIS